MLQGVKIRSLIIRKRGANNILLVGSRGFHEDDGANSEDGNHGQVDFVHQECILRQYKVIPHYFFFWFRSCVVVPI